MRGIGYLAVYEHRAGGYSGFAPDLQGCIATGEDLVAMQKSMREAVDAHVALLVERGEKIPEPTTTTIHFSHPSEGHGIDHWVVEPVEIGASKSERASGKLKASIE
jgi:predicted RNase H-like HicB family nuclease